MSFFLETLKREQEHNIRYLTIFANMNLEQKQPDIKKTFKTVLRCILINIGDDGDWPLEHRMKTA